MQSHLHLLSSTSIEPRPLGVHESVRGKPGLLVELGRSPKSSQYGKVEVETGETLPENRPALVAHCGGTIRQFIDEYANDQISGLVVGSRRTHLSLVINVYNCLGRISHDRVANVTEIG